MTFIIKRLFIFLAGTFCCFGAYANIKALKADIIDIPSIRTEFYVRLSEKPINYNVSFLKSPYRLVIDIAGLEWKADSFHKKGNIRNVRYGMRPNGNGRIVLDLKHSIQNYNLTITPHPRVKKLWLMSVLLHQAKKSIPPIKTIPIKKKKNNTKISNKKKSIKKSFSFKSKHKFQKRIKYKNELLVVIDPGHGGNDPGAISLKKKREKDIVLQFSKEFHSYLNQIKGVRAILTRDKDFYIALKERVALGRYYNADLFISIHADSLHNHAIQGATIYTLSQKASDDFAAQLAIHENSSDIMGGVSIEEDELEEVSDILSDLLQRETDNYSYNLAEYMTTYLKPITPMMNKAHRQAGFAVLKAPDIPSILIELGYLTNQQDEQRLVDRSWRSKIIKSLSKVIQKWHKQKKII